MDRRISQRSLIKFFIVFLLLVTQVVNVYAAILSGDRRIDWLAGIPGGIPDIQTVTNIMDFGAKGDGTTDDLPALLLAIESVTDGGAILIPAGTYLLSDGFTISKSVVLRGEGADKTKLIVEGTSNTGHLVVGGLSQGAWTDVSYGATKGSQTITLNSTDSLNAGDLLQIREVNRTNVGQVVEIESISGNQVQLERGLYFTFTGHIEARKGNYVTHVGFEDLHINFEPSVKAFRFVDAAYSWVRGCQFKGLDRSNHPGNGTSHFYLEHSYRLEFRGNYLKQGDYGIASVEYTTDALVIDNIFEDFRHSQVIYQGAVGNVYAYNYSVRPTVVGNVADISMHGGWAQYNLIEGNSCIDIAVTDWWGAAGPGNTFLRNRIRGNTFFLQFDSHQQNIIGNDITALTGGTNDGTCKDIIYHGNYEAAYSATQWDPSMADLVIPSSYFLLEKPDFFGDLRWPVHGPELTANRELIPAEQRWGSGEYTNKNFQISSTADPVPSASSPSAPTNLVVVTHSDNQIDLSWTDNSSNETGFKVYRSLGGVSFTPIATTIGINLSTYSDTNVSGSTTYYYRVRATNVAADSDYSNVDSDTTLVGPPTAPTGLVVNATSDDRINLSWTDNSSDETGFEIKRSTNGFFFVTVATVGINVTRYSDTSVSGSITYDYRVRATNTVGNSSYSNVGDTIISSSVESTWLVDPTVKSNAVSGVRYSESLNGDVSYSSDDELSFEITSGPAWLSLLRSTKVYTFDALGSLDQDDWIFTDPVGTGVQPANTAARWSHDNDATATVNVGPTSGAGGSLDGYLYTESSKPASANDEFTMEYYTSVDAETEDIRVLFKTNQRGNNNNATCYVETNESGAGWVTRATFGGADDPDKVATARVDIWSQRDVDLSGIISDASTLIRLRVVFPASGSIWDNDYGIDEIQIIGTGQYKVSGTPGPGDIGLNSFTVGVSDGTNSPEFATLEITVDSGTSVSQSTNVYTFDTLDSLDQDDWIFTDSIGTGVQSANTAGRWSHNKNSTATVNVGPTSGAGGASDGYIYTEASTPGSTNDEFTMEYYTSVDAETADIRVLFKTNQRGNNNNARCYLETNEAGAGWVVREKFGGAADPDKVATAGEDIWSPRDVDLSGVISDASTRIRLRVVFPTGGNIWDNDYGIDEVQILSVGQY